MMVKNAYTTKQVADNLGIVTSTLRKWCLMIEDPALGNYQFERNLKDQRVFYDHDLLALRSLKKLTQEDGITLENAVKTIGDKLREQKEITDSVMEENAAYGGGEPESEAVTKLEAKIDKLLAYIERQEERFDQQERFNRELISKLDEQQRYINESIDRRDQQLMIAMREVQETQKLIAGTKEESKGFFAKLFRK